MKGFYANLLFSFKQEFRQWQLLIGLFIFTALIAYVSFRIKPSIDTVEFTMLFWTFTLLIGINVAIRAESLLSTQESMWLYTLTSSAQFIAARVVYTVIYLLATGVSFYLFLILFYYPGLQFSLDFLLLIGIMSVVMGSCLSLLSAIAARTSGQNVLLSILSIPLLIPAVLLLSNISIELMMSLSMDFSKIISLLAISLLSIGAAIFLHPYIWRQ